MASPISENSSSWLVDGSSVTINGKTMPPRDPNDDDEDVDEEDEDEDDDESSPKNRRSCANRTMSSRPE